MYKPELLAPAGNLEKLEWAIAYGADAVYFGMQDFSLRNFADNFTLDDAAKGISLLHKQNKKAYITLNIYPFSDEIPKMIELAKQLQEIGADAFIVSDLGVIFELRKNNIKVPVHVSTQANSVNYQTVLAYKELGAKRVNLARELSIHKIEEIQKNIIGKGIETEVFIHGAVCFSYSGRCAISDYLTGRKANRGECTHPCRWGFYLSEQKRQDQFFPVFEDKRGLYLFNDKDLALFPFIKKLKDIQVESFKIEGRMKTIHYLATVVSLYRRVLDGEDISEENGLNLLGRVPNRGYSYGFMKGNITPDDYRFDGDAKDSANSLFVANSISDYEIRVRNKIHAGEVLELLAPGAVLKKITIPKPLVIKGGGISDLANNEDILIMPEKLPAYSILRRVDGR